MNKETLLSVNTLMSLYSNSLTSTLDAQVVIIEGFYQDNLGKLYGKFYYDQILDKDKKSKITIQLTENLKSKLTTGRYYNLEGYINKSQTLDNDSRLNVYFRATKVLKHEEDVQLISKVEYDIVRERFDREFPIIKDILLSIIENNSSPLIGIITGNDSTAVADYKSQLSYEKYYDITIHKCNLSSKTEIINLICSDKLAEYDLIIVIRGGGSGLEVFNDVELSKKFIEQSIPFITGIGHKEDVTLLQRVADKAFATPTAVGVFLQKVVEIHKNNRSIIDEKDFEILKKQEEFLSFKSQIILNRKKSNKIITGFIIIILLLIIKLYIK